MAKISNFDTDFYGMNQFKNIMESQGIVTKDDVKKFLCESVEKMAEDTNGDLTPYLNFNDGLSLVLTNESLENGETGILASIRETGSHFMVREWTKVGKGRFVEADDVDDDFDILSDEMYGDVIKADPEEEDEPLVDREETIYDSLPDFKGSFDSWKDSINADGTVPVTDVNLGKVDSEGSPRDAVVFTLKDDITDSDHDSLDQLFTEFMPQVIADWLLDKVYDYQVTGKKDFAFIAKLK